MKIKNFGFPLLIFCVFVVATPTLAQPARSEQDEAGKASVSAEDGESGSEAAEDPAYTQAYALYEKDKYRQAIEVLDRAIGVNDKNPDYFKLKSHCLAQLKDYRNALLAAQNAVQLKPNDADSYELMANAAALSGDNDTAIEHYQRALSIDPRSGRLYNNYMSTLKDAQRWDDLKKVFSTFEHLENRDEIDDLPQFESDIYFYASLAYKMSGDSETELTLLNKAIALESEFAGYFINRGNIYIDRRDFTLALTDLNTAIALDRKDPVAYFNRGRTFLEMEQYEKSTQDFLQARKLGDNDWKLEMNLGNAYKGMGKYKEALAAYNKALQLDPGNTKVKNNLALLYSEMGDTGRSSATYRDAQQSAEDGHIALYNQALDLMRHSDFDKAMPLLLRALEIKQDFAEAANQLGLCYIAKKQFILAEQTLTKAITTHPEDQVLYANRARAHIGLNDFVSAEKDYMQALKVAPNFIDLYYAMASMYLEHGNRQKAGEYFSLAEAASVSSEAYYIDYCGFLYGNGRTKQAIALGEKGLGLYPHSSQLLLNLAAAYEEDGQVRKAEGILKKLIEADPGSASALNNLGNLYLKKQDSANAIKYFKLSIEKDSTHIEPYISLASVYESLSQYDSAQLEFETLLRRFPDHYRAYYSRALFYANRGMREESTADFEKSFVLIDVAQAASPNLNVAEKIVFSLLKADGYQRMHRCADAIGSYQAYLVFKKNNPEAYSNYAYCLIETGDIQRAASQLEAGYTLQQDNVDILIGSFVTRSVLNDSSQARKYRRLIESHLKSPLQADTLETLMSTGYFYSEKFQQLWRSAVSK